MIAEKFREETTEILLGERTKETTIEVVENVAQNNSKIVVNNDEESFNRSRMSMSMNTAQTRA